jgi:uncharacterized protein (TIRG00374 family)
MLILVITAWRYHIILKKLDIKLKFKDSFLVSTAGLSMLITPGGAGAIIKSHILKQKIDQSFSSTAPIMIYEKGIEFLSIVIMIGVLLFWVDFLESKIVFVLGLIFISFIFIIFRYSIGLQFLNKLIVKIKLKSTINVKEFQKTTKKLNSPVTFTGMLSITLLTKVMSMFVVFLVFKSFDLDLDIFQSGQIHYTSLIMGVLTFIPGGIIVTESGLLGLIIKSGIEFGFASILVIVIRFVTMWFGIIIGFIALKIVLNKNNIIKKR